MGARGYRKRPKICSACRKPINQWRGVGVECASCLKVFHKTCLTRVRLRYKKCGYYVCDKCLLTQENKDRILISVTANEVKT